LVSSRPNFLLFITDQQRADHLGCYGNEILKTPNIDSIAAKGTRFDRFYITSPLCQPNRASLMTGRLPSLHGVRCNGAPLPMSERTYVESLRDTGYRTALFGKSHLQNVTGRHPDFVPSEEDFAVDEKGNPLEARKINLRAEGYNNEQTPLWHDEFSDRRVSVPFYGFETVEVAINHGDRVTGDYKRWLHENHPDADSLPGRENALPDNRITAPQAWRTRVPEELYPTAFVGKKTVEFLEDHSAKTPEQPFFIQCSFPDPHHPFTPPGKYWDMYDPATIPLPESFYGGESPMAAFIRKELTEGNPNRERTLPYAVTEREAKETIALTYGMITMIDDWVGEVLKTLDRLGLSDNTVLMFTSDHGDYMGDHGLMLKGPIHLHNLLRVPFIWHDPQTKTIADTTALGSTLDISTTVLARAGVLPYYGIQGQSLLEMLSSPNETVRESVLIEDDRDRVYLGWRDIQRIRTMVTDRYRMSLYDSLDWNELYDLEEDPNELNNLWDDGEYTSTKASLQEQLLRLVIEHQDRTPLMVQGA